MTAVPPSVIMRERMLEAREATYPQMRKHLMAIAKAERCMHRFSFDAVAGIKELRTKIASLRQSLEDPSYPYPHVADFELEQKKLRLYVARQYDPSTVIIDNALRARERVERKMPESARRALNWIKS